MNSILILIYFTLAPQMNNNDDNNNNNSNKTVDELYSGISNGSVFAEEFYQDIYSQKQCIKTLIYCVLLDFLH